jgi:hypothetical protein
MSYRYVAPLGKTFNWNFVVERYDKQQWVGKISRSLSEKGENYSDLNLRARVAMRLMQALDLPVLPWRVVNISEIEGLPRDDFKPRIDDAIWLTKLTGQSITDLGGSWLTKIKDKQQLWDNMIFNLFVGNYDRKDGDYLVDEGGNLWCIDYQLCGPTSAAIDAPSLGAYAEAYSLADPEDSGWCLGSPRILNHVLEVGLTIEQCSGILQRIQQLTDSRLMEITGTYANWLITRRDKVRLAFAAWIRAGYPKGQRPKDAAKADDLYPDVVEKATLT